MIRSITLQRFRGIREGKLEDFTPLTILVGPNGCGKSAILDALLLGSSPSPAAIPDQIIQTRMKSAGSPRWLLWKSGREGEAVIEVTTNDAIDADRRKIVLTQERGGEEDDLDGLWEVSGNLQTFLSIRGKVIAYQSLVSSLRGVENVALLDGQAPSFQKPLVPLYTATVEHERQEDAFVILVQVIPGFKRLEILAKENTPILYIVTSDKAVPVEVGSEGVQALVRQCLELTSRTGGVALIEEPESHLHPGAMLQSAKVIYAAMQRGIQIILTTHSLEMIDAILRAFPTDEELEKLSLYGLQLREGCLSSYRLTGSQVAFARGEIGDDLR